MAFPTTGILDAFTRANESPLANSTWAGPMQNGAGQLRLVSNQAVLVAGVSGQSYWSSTTVGPDTEVMVDVPTLATSAHGVAVWARLANPGNASTATAYLLAYTVGTGFRYFKFTVGNTFTQLGSTDAATMSAGDSIGLAVTGSATTTLAGFKKTGGTWSALPTVPTVTDASSPITAAGFIGTEGTDTTVVLDNFGGGTVVAASTLHNLSLLGVG